MGSVTESACRHSLLNAVLWNAYWFKSTLQHRNMCATTRTRKLSFSATEGHPLLLSGLSREDSLLLTPEGGYLPGAVAINDAIGTPISNTVGDPYAYFLGLRRDFYVYPALPTWTNLAHCLDRG